MKNKLFLCLLVLCLMANGPLVLRNTSGEARPVYIRFAPRDNGIVVIDLDRPFLACDDSCFSPWEVPSLGSTAGFGSFHEDETGIWAYNANRLGEFIKVNVCGWEYYPELNTLAELVEMIRSGTLYGGVLLEC
jgi:hypothetical protein